ncbi:MAG: ABC transporter ATP-binding protein [Oscillospiraceae bacterium]|jgi:ABC-2 type transport system ATP-binding protein|nr:ABC transporter ATP-binding protein [Oscillospiraceae bacterium]
MIEVKNLSKRYGANKAVDGISFTAEDGKILGFLGPNGAGKTTTMNMLTGYISSNEGQALLNGFDILENPIEAKRRIGYLPEHPPLYLDMSVDEYLSFVYSLKKSKMPKRSHLNEICELVKIADMRKRLIRNLSKGYRQRVGLAQALVGNPPILILDEPTVGLDPKQIIEIRSLIKKLGKNHTVILSSHILPEVQAVCDKILIINKGRIVADDDAESLSANLSADRKLVMQIEGGLDEIKKLLSSVDRVERVTVGRETEPNVREYEIEARPGADVRRDVSKKLANRNFPILMMKSSELTLEEIFLKITTGDIYGHTETPEPEETKKAEKPGKAPVRSKGGDRKK